MYLMLIGIILARFNFLRLLWFSLISLFVWLFRSKLTGLLFSVDAAHSFRWCRINKINSVALIINVTNWKIFLLNKD